MLGENKLPWVPPGDSGAFADALTLLLARPEEASRLGCNARRRVEERFDATFVAQQNVNWYSRVIGRCQ